MAEARGTDGWLRNAVEDWDLDGRIILKWILQEEGVRVWTGFTWLIISSSGGLLRTDKRTSGCVKGDEFLDQLDDFSRGTLVIRN
jgi:hypothetical protein